MVSPEAMEFRVHFGEFLRLDIEGTWQRISGFREWRLHGKIKKADEAVDNQDYDGDGDQTDELWINDGSVTDTTNNGW